MDEATAKWANGFYVPPTPIPPYRPDPSITERNPDRRRWRGMFKESKL